MAKKETEIPYGHKILKAFKKAESNGWKKWGKFYKKNGSSYQCFRKGNEYIWIGFRFAESVRLPHSIDYIGDGLNKLNEILS